MATGGLNWRGPEVQRLVQEATEGGLMAVAADCVKDAKEHVPVVTGNLQRSIKANPPETKGNITGLVWGSHDVHYALAIETGNRSLIGPEDASARDIPPTKSPGKNHGNVRFLRGAADKFYPQLGKRIQDELSGRVA